MQEDRRYCVYYHKKASDGDLFYIGSGVEGKRENHFQHRSKSWHEIADKYGVRVGIYKSGLTLQEARKLENELIEEFASILVNKRKHCERKIDFADFVEYVAYDEKSPTFLTWLQRTGPRSKIGSPAGNLSCVDGKPRQTSIMVNGHKASISRLVWTMFHGDIPEGFVIDHIDGNHHNNNILNLRAVSPMVNSRNRRFNWGRELPVGIVLQDGNFVASFTDNNKRTSSSYSISKYGREEALAKAISWRNNAIFNANQTGAGYESGHFTGDTLVDSSHTVDSFTGVSGVVAKRVKGELKAFEALYHREGKRFYKSFSINKYGYDKALELATQYRKSIELNENA